MTEAGEHEELVDWLTIKVAGYLNVSPDTIGIDIPLADCGIDSIAGMSLCADLQYEKGFAVETTIVWDYATIDAIATYLVAERPTVTPIAVVGIDCRFPGAPDKEAFWRLLMDGVVTDTEVSSQRWDVDAYYHPDGVAGSMNTRRAHFIDDVDAFDNDFFGIAPVEAAALDPQQRLLLQTSWRALEDAGIDPRSLAGTRTGVFVGMMSSEWGIAQMLDFAGLTAFSGAGSGYFMTANRISYHLNLTGPSMAIDTACSSSLMAVHQGCAALALRRDRHCHRRRCESDSDTCTFDLLHPGRAVRAGWSLQTVRAGRRRHRPG